MRIRIKSFEELSKDELYKLLQLRSEVFVVEQECAYQDVDGMDQQALHLLCFEDDDLIGYTRIFPPGIYKDRVHMGRVVVRDSYRGKGLGVEIMKASLEVAKSNFPKAETSLSAQTYLVKFYRDLGFLETGNEYLEDGIPHILMVKR